MYCMKLASSALLAQTSRWKWLEAKVKACKSYVGQLQALRKTWGAGRLNRPRCGANGKPFWREVSTFCL